MKPIPKTIFLSVAVLALGSCATQSAPVAAQPSCCVKAETPAAFTDKSIYQTESIWTTDSGKHIKLNAFAGRPQVLAMFFANCQFACPIIVNDMKRIEAALPPQLQGVVGFTLVSFDSKRDTQAALAEYRQTRDLSKKNWMLMRGSPDDVLELAALLGVKFKENATGQFAHANIITILNAQGEIVHQQIGLSQDIQETVRFLQKLTSK